MAPLAVLAIMTVFDMFCKQPKQSDWSLDSLVRCQLFGNRLSPSAWHWACNTLSLCDIGPLISPISLACDAAILSSRLWYMDTAFAGLTPKTLLLYLDLGLAILMSNRPSGVLFVACHTIDAIMAAATLTLQSDRRLGCRADHAGTQNQ